MKFFRVGQAGQWRGTLSDGDLDYLDAIAGPMMRALGYTDT